MGAATQCSGCARLHACCAKQCASRAESCGAREATASKTWPRNRRATPAGGGEGGARKGGRAGGCETGYEA
eukprot:11956161-Alexandrium_andersonii.AAC.1